MSGEATGDEHAAQAQAARPDPESGEQRPPAGDPRVDAALARLDELAGLPVTEHAGVFEDVHRRLEDVLDELDSGPLTEARQGSDAAPGPGR